MFPQLRHLVIKAAPDRNMAHEFISLLLSPTITKLGLVDVGHWPFMDRHAVFARCTRLKHLYLEHNIDNQVVIGEPVPADFYLAFLEATNTCERLTSVCLRIRFPYRDDIVLALATCRALTELDFSLEGDGNHIQETTVSIPRPGFTALTSLRGDQVPISLVQSIISSAYARPMIFIEVVVPIYTHDALQGLLSTVRDHCRHDTLSALVVNGLSAAQDRESHIILQKSDLATLAVFRRLLRVELIGLCTDLAVEPGDWDEIVEWWPKLLHMQLDVHAKPNGVFAVPIAALAPFSKRCPRLERLFLPIDATAPPVGRDVAPASEETRHEIVGSRPPLELLVGDAPIGNADAVAEYLLAIFPSLRDVVHDAEVVYSNVDYNLDNMEETDLESYWKRRSAWERVNGKIMVHHGADEALLQKRM
ncbi:hypothetical protein BD626DRAFT_40851 [Schizophyllum amplum]|uniref:F-box domain-containing protein n=1 Tax=Schizophyllum amplum TaxID=97359 RepID=A0A550CDL4_9AGAR|nr:hypothetical protein BD626DRAFT_40851 [Auriculariopsis ampla]